MTEVPSAFAQEVRAYFEVLRAKQKHVATAVRHVDRYMSSRFNVFELIAPDENRISDVLRLILDPDGPHGQGRVFLKTFLGRLGIGLGDTCSPTVHREVRTARSERSLRRMDILIAMKTMGVAIETKLGAADQPGQIAAYHEELGRRYGRHGATYRIVYLTPDGRPPSGGTTGSFHADPRHLSWSFGKQILEWLDECQSECRSDKFRWFLRDFGEYLRIEWPATSMEVRDDPK